MMNPRVGDIVWFRPAAHETNLASDMPLAAIVTHVHHNALVNLIVFGKGGDSHQRASAMLWNGEGDVPERISYAEWMPDRDKVGDAPKVDDLPRLKGETDADYESRNSLNRKKLTDDWSRKNGVAAPGSDPVKPAPVDEKKKYSLDGAYPSPQPPVPDLPRLAGETDEHYKTRNEASRKQVTDARSQEKKPVYRATPVKPAAPTVALPPAPVDPDPYGSAVE
jgi:hypothetical protein